MKKYTPLDYIKIDAANQYGHDKWKFENRIAWFDRTKHKLVKKAEKPYQFAAALHAYNDAMCGIPSGHLVGLDACASGISLMGILIGCYKTASNTGVIGTKRMDMYSECTKAMKKICPDIKHDRKDVKEAQMTYFYGSTLTPQSIFGKDTAELEAFYLAQETVAPGAVIVMDEFLDSWQAYALKHSCTLPDGFDMVVPVLNKIETKIEIDELDHAAIKYTYEDNVGSEYGLSIAANMTHACDGFVVRETIRRCNYDRKQLLKVRKLLNDNLADSTCAPTEFEKLALNYNFLSLEMVEHIRKSNVNKLSFHFKNSLIILIDEVLEYEPFPVLTIHDEFKCHPNHMNRLRFIYIEVLAEIAESRMLEYMIQQVRNDYGYKINKLSDNLGDAIRNGNYALS
jgi:hypothetical protein